MALAIAASRLSVSMIGVPSAACSANSFRPGCDLRHLREQRVHVLGTDRLHVGDLPVAEMGERFRRDFACFISVRFKSDDMALDSFSRNAVEVLFGSSFAFPDRDRA